MITKEEVVSSVRDLPMLGATFARLSALDKDESAEVQDFAQVIETDPALMGNLLRLANSAEFGLSRRVVSAAQALSVLGTRRVMSVALAAAFRGVLPKKLAGYGIDSETVWLHSIAVGVLSEEIARVSGILLRDESFVAGLLHDIGKLVTSTFLEREAKAIAEGLEKKSLLFLEAEREVMDVDHCVIGETVAQRWDLPPGIAAVARWHHEPSEMEGADDEILQPVVDAAHLADCLAHALGYGTDIGELSRRIDPEAMKRLDLSMSGLEEAASRAAGEIEERKTALDQGK